MGGEEMARAKSGYIGENMPQTPHHKENSHRVLRSIVQKSIVNLAKNFQGRMKNPTTMLSEYSCK